jgi:dTDP-4-dehydrorhamnose 3,5-epimerase-like enzyme
MNKKEPTLISLPKFNDDRGNLVFLENNNHIPFEIKRAYFLYDVPKGSDRGAHAHKALHQFIIAIHGSFEISINDGLKESFFTMDSPSEGLYVPPMRWRDLKNFSLDAVCMVFASDFFDESDYIRDFNNFLKITNSRE